VRTAIASLIFWEGDHFVLMPYLAAAISFVQVASIKVSEEMILSNANAVKPSFAAIRYYCSAS
jgi:hypothetical protein